MSAKPKREGPLKVPFAFDDAIRRAMGVKPPPEGWKEYERARARANRRGRKPTLAKEDDDSGDKVSGEE